MENTHTEVDGTHKIAVLIDVQNMNANTPYDTLFKLLESRGRIEV